MNIEMAKGLKGLLSIFYRNGSYTFLGKVLIALIIFLIARLLIKIIINFLEKLLRKRTLYMVDEKRLDTLRSILVNSVRALIWLLAAFLILDLFGVNTSSLIATAGIGGVAIAFGAQSLVKDVISGATILLDEEFAVGETVDLNGNMATVEDINLRSTILRDYEGNLYYIPNGSVDQVINYSRKDQRSEIVLYFSYDIAFSQVEELTEKIRIEAEKVYRDFSEPISLRGISSFNENSYCANITCMVKNGDQFMVNFILREEALRLIQEAGIDTSSQSVRIDEVKDEEV